MIRIVTADEMRQLDRYAIEKLKIPAQKLIAKAGRSVFEKIQKEQKKLRGKNIFLFCGPGNNGADGKVIAKHLKGAGAQVFINQTKSKPDLIVDAIFGTGLSRKVSNPYKSWIQWINRQTCPVYSVDIPSGLHSDSGEEMGVAVLASHTFAIQFPKLGFYQAAGPDHIGKVSLIDIGILDSPKIRANYFEIEKCDFKTILKNRGRNTHKGSFGHALLIAGSPKKSGAAVLACKSAYRSGAGLVTLATTKSAHTILKRQIVEAMSEILEEVSVKELLQNKSAIGVGPGIDTNLKMQKVLLEVLKTAKVPVVIDADGLNLIANRPSRFFRFLKGKILTPHPGEMARLCKSTTKAIQKNRVKIAQDYSKKTGAITVLKGAYTVVAFPNGEIFINPTGNPAMATGGTGDVLAGLLVGLLAQKSNVREAVLGAVYLHGLAGDRWVVKHGPRGMLASDLIDEIPLLFNRP